MKLKIGAAVAVIVGQLLMAVPANAAPSTESSSDSPFESAQEALGLSSDDAAKMTTGVSATATESEAVVALGDFEVKVTAPEGNDSATTILPDGVRVMSLLDEGESSASFTVDLPKGATLTPNGGGFDVVVDAGGTRISLGQIEAPWAVDANGTKLSTSYTLAGDTLTQSVNTEGAAYPIVADPAVTVGVGADGPGVYWNMTGAQAKAISAASASAVALALAGGCAGASKVPKIGGMLSALCGFVGAPTLSSVFGDIKKILTNSKIESNACYQLRIPLGSGLHKTGKANCA
ncbi:hypothetical protein [Microbacterium sp. Root553]|uniref:hypothetical protein n=1 Tax=Microbacterium sp. Root553 TaxID=1736556 RepID=UPI0006FB22C2|nr:hypothetical protein [Microbacterium sp. Root553]KQZ22328.1 hypothetical protein ASD43_16595 [Microbacterium sp. Root553]